MSASWRFLTFQEAVLASWKVEVGHMLGLLGSFVYGVMVVEDAPQ